MYRHPAIEMESATESAGTSVAPGKRPLTANLQRRGDGRPPSPVAAASADTAATEAADPFWFATGPALADGGSPLPHHDTIQHAFGRHDVGGIEAHVGGAAAEGAAGLGAMAYATGNQVAFAEAPDLHTAAHEAAHVVQQRAGISLLGGLDGGDGDPLERHADEVASLVTQGRSAEALLDEHAGGAGAGAATTIQRRRIFVPFPDGAMSLESENLSWDKLEEMLMDEALPAETRRDIMRAIDAGEVQGGYPGAYEYARDHLDFFRVHLPKMGDVNEYTWIRRITGGGAGSLSGKRDADGIKTDMSEAEYDTTAELTAGFYDTADELNRARPREHFLTLYRGFTVPQIGGGNGAGAIEGRIAAFSDQLPSSAAWQREMAISMSAPGDGESAVLVYMAIPPEHPIVIMSYPSNQDPDGAPRHLDIGQAEVLVAASTYEDVEVFRVENLPHGRVRYHVSVTLVARDRGEVMDGIETARATAAVKRAAKPKNLNVGPEDLAATFGDEALGIIPKLPEDGSHDKAKVWVDQKGGRWLLVNVDHRFGYDFEEVRG